MFSEAEVRATMVKLHDDALSRGDRSTACVYAWSAIRLGNVIIERKAKTWVLRGIPRFDDRRGENGRGS